METSCKTDRLLLSLTQPVYSLFPPFSFSLFPFITHLVCIVTRDTNAHELSPILFPSLSCPLATLPLPLCRAARDLLFRRSLVPPPATPVPFSLLRDVMRDTANEKRRHSARESQALKPPSLSIGRSHTTPITNTHGEGQRPRSAADFDGHPLAMCLCEDSYCRPTVFYCCRILMAVAQDQNQTSLPPFRRSVMPVSACVCVIRVHGMKRETRDVSGLSGLYGLCLEQKRRSMRSMREERRSSGTR